MVDLYSVQGLTKAYGDRQVLAVPSLRIRQGELLAVVGPSGAGKSTLLRLLHFLEGPTQGEIAYSHNGELLYRTSERAPLHIRRRIGMVFQRPEMAHGSVTDNAALGLKFRGLDDPARVRRALQAVDIAHLADADVRGLSGGELQRVAIARVLAIAPDVILFDEPTANLDPANVQAVESIVRRMNADGATVVLVTHNVFQARRLADRVAFFLGGNLIETSESEKFFNHPDDERSLAFVRGEMVY